MAHPCTTGASSGGEMIDRHSDRLGKRAPILVLVALGFSLGGCSAGMNCALFGLQCGAPTPEQQAKADDDAARIKQEDATLAPTGHYGTPYGPGPQYGEAGGDQYGYGPAYSYARQAPPSDKTDQRE
jgi:hypothetical protein